MYLTHVINKEFSAKNKIHYRKSNNHAPQRHIMVGFDRQLFMSGNRLLCKLRRSEATSALFAAKSNR